MNPIGILWGDLNVGIDFVVDSQWSVELQGGYRSSGISIGDVTRDYEVTAIPVTFLGKYYFQPERKASKIYALIFFSYVDRSFDFEPNSLLGRDYDEVYFGPGFGVGYKFVLTNNFVFDLNAGLGRAFFHVHSASASNIGVDVDAIVTGKIAIGYRFTRKGKT